MMILRRHSMHIMLSTVQKNKTVCQWKNVQEE